MHSNFPNLNIKNILMHDSSNPVTEEIDRNRVDNGNSKYHHHHLVHYGYGYAYALEQ
jgi:hypothetical protein